MIFYLWDEAGRPSGTIDCDPNGPLLSRCTPVEPPAPIAGHHVVWRGAWVQELEVAPDLDDLKAKLSAQVTALRWQRETGGLMLGGVRVATGLADQNRIASVLSAIQVSQLDGVDFKAESGWVYLTAAELQAVAAAITAHVQACFTAERVHHEAINALTDVADAQDYDVTTGWPE